MQFVRCLQITGCRGTVRRPCITGRRVTARVVVSVTQRALSRARAAPDGACRGPRGLAETALRRIDWSDLGLKGALAESLPPLRPARGEVRLLPTPDSGRMGTDPGSRR